MGALMQLFGFTLSTAETGEILDFAKTLQQKAAASGMFAFPGR